MALLVPFGLFAVGLVAYLVLRNPAISISERYRRDNPPRCTAREWHDRLWEDLSEPAAHVEQEWLTDDPDQAVIAHGGPVGARLPAPKPVEPPLRQATCPGCGDPVMTDGGSRVCPACRAAGLVEDAALIVKRASRASRR